MAFNLYGKPILDTAAPQQSVELPQRTADGRHCNIFGDPIDDAATVAIKNQQLPPAPKHIQLVQGTIDTVIQALGSLPACQATTTPDLEDTEDQEYDSAWRHGPAGHGLYTGGILIDDDGM